MSDAPPAADSGWTIPVRELLGATELGLRVLAGAAALDREVSWAHVSELVDPTEFLQGGELLLLTGVSLPAGEQAQHTYVQRLADAGVAAIGFGIGLSWEAVPPALVTAAERAGLPLLEVPRATPFLAITRAVAQAISRRERAAQEQLLHAQRALTAAAVGRGGLAAVLDEIHRLVGGWALLLNRGGAVLASSPPAAAEHRARLRADLARLREAPGAASLVARDGDTEIWVQSLTAGTEMLGYLAIGRATPLTAVERQVVNAAVPLCTLSLDRSRVVGQGSRRLQASVLRLLLAGQSGLVESVAGELWNGLPAEPVIVWECRATRFALVAARERLVADRQLASARVVYGELDDVLVGVVSAEFRGGVPAGDLERLLRALRGVDGLRIGMSEPAGYGELAAARGQARRAAEYGTGSDTRVTWFREIPRLGLLELLPPERAAEFAASVLRPLRTEASAGTPGRRAELLRSLRVWLAHHGQWDPAAGELGVHRHTLRNRMQRVEQLLGRELDSPDLRAELWLALRLDERRAGTN
ncbi:MAG TPA: PucR family transcriptional regulator [Pseudonocardia sp.]|uniref:PucR family transcriptional regulator n=1 Tax=Pseudonocardia sp. TaxID=60912 RepID=UPI002BF64434|nr:PucR family transcriptional regulator [Pseudonocardia sp.]HTF54547.1 PucR family transcriptional regulator [Pseudonocardia sp.]